MQYSVVLDAIDEPGFEGYYYAHIPTLDLTTQGKGIEGAMQAARDLAELWVAERRSRGEPVPRESDALIARIEIPDAVLSP
ncbi:MAG: type II toxin-antitoxin system HicB family antitoxin [Spirochaetaceae bacterium]|nr:type II toxin-antitoxin system HicB family antitoxin [Spirochaetaceae bacterium]